MPTHSHTGAQAAKLNTRNKTSHIVGSGWCERAFTGATYSVYGCEFEYSENHHCQVVRCGEIDVDEETQKVALIAESDTLLSALSSSASSLY